MPTTRSFSQRLLAGSEFPSELKVSLHRSRIGFVEDVKKALPNPASPTFVGLAIFVSHDDGLLEAFAIAFPDDRVFVLHLRVSRGMQLQGAVDAAFTDGAEGHDLTFNNVVTPVAFGAARIAMHVKHKLKWDIMARDMGDIDVPGLRNKRRHYKSPSALVQELLDPSAIAFDVEELWDKSPRDQQNEGARIHDLSLRAWLTAT